MSSADRHVAIVGGGLAGIAAATVLSERGVRVSVFEKEAYLGGRLGAWPDTLSDGRDFQMERGFHAFFRQYYNLRSLLRRIDPTLSFLKPLQDYPVVAPHGKRQSFTGLATRPPLNVIDMVRKAESLRLRDLPKVNVKAALEMLRFDPERSYAHFDDVSAREYLDSLNFPPDARRMLFDVFSHSFFNPEEQMSAAEMLAMFHFYFMGNADGLIFDVLTQPFSTAFWQPIERQLSQAGVVFHMQTAVSQLTASTEGSTHVCRIHTSAGGEPVSADALVLALDVVGLKSLVAGSDGFGEVHWREQIAALDVTLPFAVLRLWLNTSLPQRNDPFIGTAGFGILDNISLYHLIEDEAREWAETNKGSVVELHAYAVDENLSEHEIRQQLLQGLYAIYPETRAANVVEERFLLRRDCPSFAPGSYRLRPGIATPMPNVALAGDFVKLRFPSALMEKAVTSGMLAANRFLQAWELPREPIRHIPPRGLLTLRSRLGV